MTSECLNIFLFIGLISASMAHECFYAWAEKGQSSVEVCKTSADCAGQHSKCIYSPITSSYICCQSKQGAVLPKCPNSDTSILDESGPGNNILCDKSENSTNNELCPEDYECVNSITDFDKHPGQTSNYICCKK